MLIVSTMLRYNVCVQHLAADVTSQQRVQFVFHMWGSLWSHHTDIVDSVRVLARVCPLHHREVINTYCDPQSLPASFTVSGRALPD